MNAFTTDSFLAQWEQLRNSRAASNSQRQKSRNNVTSDTKAHVVGFEVVGEQWRPGRKVLDVGVIR